MKHPLLAAEERKVLGKKVRKLRREGLLPANVYGKNLSSVALQVKLADFQKVYKEVGTTGLVDLQFDGKAKPVLIKNLQIDYSSHTLLHADFYQVSLKEKIKAVIKVILTGEAPAVAEKVGLLLQTMNEVEVEALPDKLPEQLEVSIEKLAALDETVTVADLVVPADVTVLTDAGQVLAKITELPAEEPEPEAPAEEGAEGEAASTEEGTEGNGEEKAEEKQAEKTE
jgi:large subunit ribosomal protein L25